MGKIGSLGKILFFVKRVHSGGHMQSFTDLRWQTGAKWEEHPVNGQKSYLEFIGPELGQVTLTIVVDAQYQARPLEVQQKLHHYEVRGIPLTLIIGGRRIGAYKWVVESLTDNYEILYKDGRPVKMTFDVTLREYRYKLRYKSAPLNGSENSAEKQGASGASKAAGSSSTGTGAKTGYTIYTIKKGDTLWGLAKKYYGSGAKYTKIYNANKKASKGFNVITDPNRLTPGWVVKIPK